MMISRMLIGLLWLGSLGFVAPVVGADHTTDSLDVVQQAVKNEKAIIIDVREQEEWNNGHLKDAKLLPLSLLNKGITAEEAGKVCPKGKIVYCHCAFGSRALTAADHLKKLGYDVRPLKPGYTALKKAGFPTEK
ncbi:MAG: rhodanese-like domain-containing protein [Zavarzinella sp.]